MPFGVPGEGDRGSVAASWKYFNQRTAEMGLHSADEITAQQIRYCPHASLYNYGITSKYTQGRDAILFQYMNENGAPLDIYQARMIGTYPDFDAPPIGMTREEHSKRLRQLYPKYIGNKQFDLHFPALATGWMNQPIIFITEGIPKAIRAIKEGLACASIQGKDMYKLKNSDLLVPGLERILRSEALKRIYYVADSDSRDRADIHDSAVHLVGMLNGRRQSTDFAQLIELPSLPNYGKTGLDDYLNTKSGNEFIANIDNWITKWEGSAFFSLIQAIGGTLCSIKGRTDYVYRIANKVISSGSAQNLVQPLLSAAGALVNPYSGSSKKSRQVNSLSNTFLADPFHNACDGITFWPGMPERIEREAGDKVFEDYNLWYDCSPKPESGDVAPFLAYAEHTIPDAFLRDTLFMLFAHRIQKPQDISPIMVYLMGREGTGKSTIFSCLFRAVTLNEEYIHQGQLELSYTHESNHINKQCVEAEDPKKSGMTNTDIESMFKTLGSNDNLTYNPKGIQAYQVKNRGVLCISSNAHYLPASGDARRWLMIESPNGQNEQLSGACYNWMATCPNWQGKLRKYLIERFPDVDPREIIKRSAASGIKQEILNENRHPHLAMFEEMIAELEEELRDLKFIPSRLMSDRHPFSEMDHGQKSNLGRVLSTEYPLATIGSGTTFSVRINGKPHNTTLRSLIKHNKVIMENEQAADIYRAWYNHPSTGRKY